MNDTPNKVRDKFIRSRALNRKRLDENETTSKIMDNYLYVCVGAYPDVDPNIVHRLRDLGREGYETVNASQYEKQVFFECRQNELLGSFGIKIDVLVPSFDFLKIQKDYGIERIPNRLVNKTGYWFSDGSTTIEIFDDEISNYRNEITEQRYVYRRDYVAQLDSDDFDWNGYFYKVFKQERDTIFGMDDTLILTLEQIKFIENKIVGLNLMKYYDEERPNVFVCFGRW